MAEELELSDYEVMGFKSTEATRSQPERSEGRLFRVGVILFGVLCILQVTLNVSLRLAFYSKEDIDQFPFNSSVIADLCHFEQMQQSSSQPCSCCNDLVRKLLKKYQAMEAERDLLQHKIDQLNHIFMDNENFPFSGSGMPDV